MKTESTFNILCFFREPAIGQPCPFGNLDLPEIIIIIFKHCKVGAVASNTVVFPVLMQMKYWPFFTVCVVILSNIASVSQQNNVKTEMSLLMCGAVRGADAAAGCGGLLDFAAH